jgi:hypothetical protein
MNETKLGDRLHHLASEMPVDLERSAPPTLRRARVRRGATALVSSAVVVAVVLGGMAVVRVAQPDGVEGPNRQAPATQVPSPTEVAPAPQPAPFAGLWPETTPEALAEAQIQVDDGHQPLRLDPEQTAVMLATNLFGWSYEETAARTLSENGIVGAEFVERGNASRAFADHDSPIIVELAQLGRTGPDGIWSVVNVSSPLVGEVTVAVPDEGDPTVITIEGAIRDLPEGADVWYEVRNGVVPANPPALPAAVRGDRFTGSWPIDTIDFGAAVLWINVIQGPNGAVGATALKLPEPGVPTAPVPEPTRTASPLSPNFTDLPLDVAVMAQRIYDAALDHEVDALAELIDPTAFVYNFDDALDPIDIWRADPGLLDPIPLILSMTPYVEEVQADRPFYVWPHLMEAGALEEISEQERADLHTLGFSDEHIAEMQAFGGYLGPRLTIAAEGTWLNYVTGGD